MQNDSRTHAGGRKELQASPPTDGREESAASAGGMSRVRCADPNGPVAGYGTGVLQAAGAASAVPLVWFATRTNVSPAASSALVFAP